MMNRRNFIRYGIGAAALTMLPYRLFAQQHMMHGNQSMPGMMMGNTAMDGLLPVDALPSGQPLLSLKPIHYVEKNTGIVRATLTAAPVTVELAPGRKTEFWAYNDMIPGPLIEAWEGDTVEIRFANRLKQASTIHWHGMPVPPDQDGNPHDPVLPGEERLYRFTLPEGSAGTYWYHPHPHGDTPEQVFRGLAGAFIVRAKNDPLAALPEQHLLISDLRLAADGAIPDNTMMDWMNGREGQFVLINGQNQPTVAINGQQRLRLWNACSARYLRLSIPGKTMMLVGTDGGLLEQAQPLDELLLSPAERAEIVVFGTGQATLVASAYNRGKMGMAPPETDLTLAVLNFAQSGKTPATVLPYRLRSVVDPGPVVARKRIVFSEKMAMGQGGQGMLFLVDDKIFDMKRIDLTSARDEVEQWEIVNNSDMDHPFHLHGTQFLVMERELNGRVVPEPYRAWKDTVNLRSQEIVRIKTVQRDSGLRMYHCHILEHEGLGMMGTLKVV